MSILYCLPKNILLKLNCVFSAETMHVYNLYLQWHKKENNLNSVNNHRDMEV
jgi:hypothetical protein